MAISAGIVLGAFNAGAVAQAAPDSEVSGPDETSTASAAQRSTDQPGRRQAPGSRTGARNPAVVRGGAGNNGAPIRHERNDALPAAAQSAVPAARVAESVTAPAKAAVDVPGAAVALPPPVAVNAVAPVTFSSPTPVRRAPVATPAPSAVATIATPTLAAQPPTLAAAVPARAVGIADALTGGSAGPLQSSLEWTMLAAARNEVGRRARSTGQTVSPLGTAEQLAAEATATEAVQTVPMQAMKVVLRLAWRVLAGSQFSQVGGPDQENIDALGAAVDQYAMAAAFQSMILNSNEPRIVTQVAPPHSWYGQDVTGSRILYDNPDTIYRFVGVNYASEYVISGRMPEGDPQASFSVLTGLSGNTAAVLNADQLELGPDGTFAITVSAAPATPGQKNHLQITPDTTLIAIRDTLSDWNSDEPMSLEIQRTAGPPNSLFSQFGGFAIPGIGPRVAQSAALTALVSRIPPLAVVPPMVRGSIAALLMLRGLSEESVYVKVATTDSTTGKPKAPNVFTDPTSNASFLATQLQSAGYFRLADDEALVLTITPNNADYFVVPVTNDWTVTDNYWDVQTSLNNTQAVANPDGSYTIVVSPSDPLLADGDGVSNWVSTGGLNQGTIAIRFQSIDQNNPANPTVSSQVVRLSELGSVLPSGTVVVTPEERAEQIALRNNGFQRRFADGS